MPNHRNLAGQALLAAALAGACNAWAGRPLTVDDAGVDDAGTGHVETWVAREPGRTRTWTVAPAWSPTEWLELGAAFSRDRTARLSSSQLSFKALLSPSRDDGCNAAVAAGATHNQGAGNTPFATAIFSCNSTWGSTHANLGLVREPGLRKAGTWGLAHERGFGPVTLSLETFGERGSKPTWQLGASTILTGKLQVDATVGRHNRETLFSLGLMHPF